MMNSYRSERADPDVAQQKRRLVLSPFLGVFMAVLCYVTAPSLLVFGLGMLGGLVLMPVSASMITSVEQGRTASAAGGGIGAVVLIALLRVVLPEENNTVMFGFFLFGFVLCAGLGLSAWARLSPEQRRLRRKR